MNNIGNLGASQTSPAMQGLTGQTGSQGNDGGLFSALLTQQMNSAGAASPASNGDANMLPGLGQNLLGADLAKLLPMLLSKNKNSKSEPPTNQQTSKTTDGPDTNPALAMWIASMAALQMQPNMQNVAPQLNDLSSQLTDAGINSDQNAALQALEQQFPGLAQVMQKVQTAADKSTNAQLADGQTSPEATAPEAADPTANKVDAKTSFDAALQAPEAAKAVAQQPAPHVNADAMPTSDKSSTTVNKNNKVDARSAVPTATGKSSQLDQVQVAPQVKTADTKQQNQGQTQSGDSHSNSQSKKDTATTTSQAAPEQNDSTTVTISATNNFAAMTHAAIHGSAASSTNSSIQQPSAPAGQEINVRDVSAAAGVEAAPRIVQAARLMEAAGQAEMRVSVKSDVVGNVDVRAMLEGDHITATVATQHDGTRDWMMANVHELHSTLSRDDMNLRSFEVSNSGLQFSGQNQPRQQEQQQQQQQSRAYTNFADESNTVSSAMNTDIDTEETASRALSLLA